MVTIPDVVEEAVKQLFHVATLSVQGEIRTVVYDAVEHIILDQIGMAVLGEKTNKPVDDYFQAEAEERLGKRLLPNEEFIAPIASFVQR